MWKTGRWHRILPIAYLAVAMCLTGCGSSVSDSTAGKTAAVTPAKGKVSLTIDWWGADSRVKVTEQAIQAFESKHPNITVETQYSDWSGYWDKLATNSAGGNAPDIMQMDELYLASYASQGSLFDMDRVSNYLNLNHMDSSLRGMGKVNGKQYAAPISSTPLGIVVNMDVLSKLGLNLPDTKHWTWDDLISFAKEVTTKSNGQITGIAPLNNGMGLQIWARQNNEQLFNENKVSISEKTLSSFLKMSYDWTHGKNPISGTADHLSEQASGTTDQSDLATNKAAMGFTQATQITVYSKAAGTDNMKLVPIPQMKANEKASYLKPGMYWTISAKSKHPAEAAMLVDFLINNKTAGKILGTERGIPSNNDIRKELAGTSTGVQRQTLDFPTLIAKTIGKSPAVTPNGASDLDKIIARYSQDVAFGKRSADDAAKSMKKEIQDNINSAQ